jgi:hypothetical protein
LGIVGAAPVPGVTRAMSDGGLIGNGIGVLLSGLLLHCCSQQNLKDGKFCCVDFPNLEIWRKMTGSRHSVIALGQVCGAEMMADVFFVRGWKFCFFS